MMKPKLISLLLLLAVVILGGVYYWQFYQKDAVDILSSVSLAPGQAAIIIDFGSKGPARLFKGEVISDMTLLDALRASAAAGNLELEIDGAAREEKIIKIDGLTEDRDGGRWNYYLGDIKLTNPLSAIFVKPGDRFKFAYEFR